MREIERVVDQLRRAYAGGAWHGPALTELLAGVDAKAAAARPLAAAHNIAEIVGHIAAWNEIVRQRLAGVGAGTLAPESDFPSASVWSERAWKAVCDRLATSQERLLEAVEHLADDALDSRAAGQSDSVYVLLHGAIQHMLYHAGQIALLKKSAVAQ